MLYSSKTIFQVSIVGHGTFVISRVVPSEPRFKELLLSPRQLVLSQGES